MERIIECPNRNNFCFVCGFFAPQNYMRNITKSFVCGYQGFFLTAYVPNCWYTPEVVCEYCYRPLVAWDKQLNKKQPFKYIMPVVWLRRTRHAADSCYFCLTLPKCFGYSYRFRERIQYADVETVLPAQMRTEDCSLAQSEIQDANNVAYEMPDLDENLRLDDILSQPPTTSNAVQSTSTDVSDFIPTSSELGEKVPHLITQNDYNDLVRDSGMSNRMAEVVASRLQQWNLVASDFKVTAARGRSLTQTFDACFSLHEESKIIYCNNINELFSNIGFHHNAHAWRLFIDSSVQSLKCVLIHNTNKFPSIPIAYSREASEDHDIIKLVLELIKYSENKWKICCDLKVVAILTGIKKGYSKHQYFLCIWEGRKTHLHYTSHHWQPRAVFKLGEHSVEHEPLVPPANIILPPLHIKLGLVRNFVRAMDRNSEAFDLLHTVFPKLSDAKIDAGTSLNDFLFFSLFYM